MRKTNFANVPVRGDTKEELNNLKNKLSKEYIKDPTWDDLMKIFLQKNKKIILSPSELNELLLKSKGVI